MHSKSLKTTKNVQRKSQHATKSPLKPLSKLKSTRGIKTSRQRTAESAHQQLTSEPSVTTSRHFSGPRISTSLASPFTPTRLSFNPIALSIHSTAHFSTISAKLPRHGIHDSNLPSLPRTHFIPHRQFAKIATPPKEEPRAQKVYDSGDEIDESEELHNKKLVKEGRYGLPPEKLPTVKRPRPPKLHKIRDLQRRYDLTSRFNELTPAELDELKSLSNLDDKITSRDKEEYRLDQEDWQRIFDKFKLTREDLEIDDLEQVKTVEEARELVKQGFKVVRMDFKKTNRYYEAHKDQPLHGIDGVTPDPPDISEIDHHLYSNIDDPEPEPMSMQDYKHMLQKLYGQPANGNPELLYIPGMKVLFRAEEFPVDKNGNMLPINYESHHLHDPYDYFNADTSTVFDVPYNPVSDLIDFRRRYSYHMMTGEEALMNARQAITTPHELHAFDAIMTSIIAPQFYSSYLSQDDSGKPYADRHWIYEAMNHPDPDQRYIPTPDEHDEWADFLFYEIAHGPPKVRWKVAGAFLTIFGFATVLATDGIMAIDQYYYDLMHPMHH